MQEDVFPAAEKILSDIEYIFKKDLNLVSFEIIPAEDNENKSPVFHDENSLGLASWCIQPLYCYVYNHLLNARQNQLRREEPAVISRWLLGALLLNPDVSTFWNMRRELTRNGRLSPIDELRFVNLVLFRKAKCFEAFSYRRWILQYELVGCDNPADDTELLFRNEMQVVSSAAGRYGNNCHAWSHREDIIQMLQSLCVERFNNFLEDEWLESTKWCNGHISDYSGFSYRQFLLRKLLLREQSKISQETILKRREIILEFVKNSARGCSDVSLVHDASYKEALDLLHGAGISKSSETKFEQMLLNLSYWVEDCTFNEDLINTFPGHEALWYHRRFLTCILLALKKSYKNGFSYKTEYLDAYQAFKLSKESMMNEAMNPIVTKENSPQSLLEIAFCARNKELLDSAQLNGSYQNDLAEKYISFLVCLELEC